MKALALMSGGLDSVLAAKLVQRQGIEVLAVNFVGWFNAGPLHKKKGLFAAKVCKAAGLPLRVELMGTAFQRIIERPAHGHGSGINPCIDCKIFMLRRAKQLLSELDAKFVITGEVRGQRPMSQHLQALHTIERDTGLSGLLVRPLCAKLLEPTVPEKEGWLDREKLYDISGRSRKRQYELAQELGITVHGAPAGGCLLTDERVTKRLRDLIENLPGYTQLDARLCAMGRHYRLRPGLKLILGRDLRENEVLRLLKDNHTVLEIGNDLPGPLGLVRGEPSQAELVQCLGMLRHYARKVLDPEVDLLVSPPHGPTQIHRAKRIESEQVFLHLKLE